MKSRWLNRHATAFQVMDLPPTPRLRSDSNPSTPGGRHNAFRSRFHDIVENERIVFAYDLLHDHRLVSVSLTTIEFFAAGDGTRLVFTEQGAFFDDVGDAAEREHGTGKLLDRLERLLAGEPVR